AGIASAHQSVDAENSYNCFGAERVSSTPASASAKPTSCSCESLSWKNRYACTAASGGTSSSSAVTFVASPCRIIHINRVVPTTEGTSTAHASAPHNTTEPSHWPVPAARVTSTATQAPPKF